VVYRFNNALVIISPLLEVLIVKMTVAGDDIVKNCRACFSSYGYGIRLNDQKGNILVCPQDSSHRYSIEDGMLKKV